MKLHTRYPRYVIALILIPVMIIGIGLLVDSTQRSKISGAELRFSEVSTSHGMKGALVPASCDTNISHFSNDCTTICQNAPNPLVVANTQYNAASNSCVCKNGKTNPPDCNLPIDPQVKLSFNQNDVLPASVTVTKRNTLSCEGYDVCYGGSTYIDWTSTKAQNCDGSWGQKLIGTSGSYYTGALIGDKQFTVTCTNTSGYSASSVTVSVKTYVPREKPCGGKTGRPCE